MRSIKLCLVCLSLQWLLCAGTQKPNIVVIVADDLGWNDVGFHGSKQIPTPSIDALAFSGVILNRYYVSPLCTPSRSSLMSGMYPSKLGMQHNVIIGCQPKGLPLEQKLLPQYLKELGYSTHAVGKWHLGNFRKEYTPTFRGFDSHFGHWLGYNDYYTNTIYEYKLNQHMWGIDMRRNLSVEKDHVGKYVTDVYTDEAVKIIKNHNTTKPLFLYVAHQAVHSALPWVPLQAPKEYIRKFRYIENGERRIYAGMVAKLDESVRSIVLELNDTGMLSNSLIVFTTDNGGAAAGFDQSAASNWPLKGVKDTLWEGGVRGVAFVWGTMIDSPHRVSMEMMAITDWLPTLVQAAGGTPVSEIDGVSQWDAIQGKSQNLRQEILHYLDPVDPYHAALSIGKYKLVVGTTYDGAWDSWFGPSGREGMRRKSSHGKKIQVRREDEALAKILRDLRMNSSRIEEAELTCDAPPSKKACDATAAPCLFDVVSDPCEFTNLYDEEVDVRRQLLKRLQEHESESVEPIEPDMDGRANPKNFNFEWTNWYDHV